MDCSHGGFRLECFLFHFEASRCRESMDVGSWAPLGMNELKKLVLVIPRLTGASVTTITPEIRLGPCEEIQHEFSKKDTRTKVNNLPALVRMTLDPRTLRLSLLISILVLPALLSPSTVRPVRGVAVGIPLVSVWSDACKSSNVTVTNPNCGSLTPGESFQVEINVTNAPDFNAY